MPGVVEARTTVAPLRNHHTDLEDRMEDGPSHFEVVKATVPERKRKDIVNEEARDIAFVVIEVESNEIQASVADQVTADTYRDALNRWWEMRPTIDTINLAFHHVEPDEAALYMMIDQIFDPEQRLDLLETSLFGR